MAEVSRILNGKTFVFPDEETARRADAALEASRIERAQKEESFFDAGAFLKSIIPGAIRGTGSAIQGIGSLIQSEGTKETGRGVRDFGDTVSENYMGLEPYRRYTTGAQLGQTAGAMAPAALAAFLAAASAPASVPTAGVAAITAGVSGLMGLAQGAGEISEDIDQARKRGVDVTPEQEQKQALAQGTITGILEAIPFHKAGKLIGLGRLGSKAIASGAGEEVEEVAKLLTMADKPIFGAGYGARALKQAAAESVTEGLQQGSQNVIARGDLSGVFGPGYDTQRDLTEGVGESLAVGALFGGALQGGQDLYVRHKINQAKAKIRQVQDQSAEVGLQREDAVIGREVDGQIRQGEVAGTLTEEINKKLNDTLTAASVTINNEEASPLDKLNAYREFAAQYNSGKTFGELRGKDIISANKLAQDFFRGESSPESLEIGIQVRESEAPGFVDMVDVKPVEGKELPAEPDTSVYRRVPEFQDRQAQNDFQKSYKKLNETQRSVVDAKVNLSFPSRIESQQQQQAAIEEAQNKKQAESQNPQGQIELKDDVAEPLPGELLGMYKSKAEGDGAVSASPSQPAVAAAPAAPVEPERGTPKPRSIPLKLDVETARRVSSEAYQQLRKLGVSDIYSTVVIDNFLDSKGNIRSDSAQFLNDVIKLASKQNNIAESEENLINTVNHEVVHGMKKSGFFSDAQWKLMTNKFTVAGELDEPTIKAYRERFKNETPARIDEILQEEAVAYAMERLYNQPAKPLSFPEKTLMQRVKALAGIGTAANNLNYTAEDLISAIRAGDIGRMAIPGKPNMLSPARTTTQAAPVVTQSPSEEQDTEALTDKEKAAAEGDVPTELQGQSKPDFSFVGGAAYSSDPVEGKRIADFRKAARKMEEDGRSNEEIRLATGWFRNPYDNILRYEVSDENAKLTQAFSDLEESKFFKEQKNITLDQALDHPELFKAYPELKDIKVIKQAGFFDMFQGLQGSFNPDTNTVNITPYSKDPESTLIHEIQHWIQEKEGFSSGGNEDSALKAASPKMIEKALAKVVKEKTDDLESNAQEVKKLRSSLDVASRYPNDIQQLSVLLDKRDKLWNTYSEDKSDANKEKHFEAGNKFSRRFGEFRDKVKLDMGVSGSAAWDIAWGAQSVTPEDVSKAEKRFVDAQNEIANIRSGDEKAIANALKSEAFGMYRNIAGEIESRDVEARRKYPDFQRSSEKPYTSENISPDDSIVTYGSKGKGIESMSKLTGDEEADLFRKPNQAITSAKTSIKQSPAVFSKVNWEEGTRNFDVGGGAYDLATNKLAGVGVENLIYDPFNRSEEHNNKVISSLKKRNADTATVANVLNVIAEPENQLTALKQADALLKPGGTAYIGIYEGDRSGVGKQTSSGYQNNSKTADYLPIVRQVFPNARIQNGIIVAQKADAPVRTSASVESVGLKGSPRKIGKRMGNDLYIHKDYAQQAGVPMDVLRQAQQRLPDGHDFDIVKYNKATDDISFIESPDFNLVDEPTVGTAIKVTPDGKLSITKQKSDPQIYHHKWEMVPDNYPGFNVSQSKKRSEAWRSVVGVDKEISSRIGTKSFWEKNVVPKINTSKDVALESEVDSEDSGSQAMFKMVEQKDPTLFKAKKEDSILNLFKAQPISQIPSTLKAVGDAIIEKPSVRKLIGPSSVLGKVLSLRTDWIQSDAPIAKQGENLFQETGNKGYTDTATSAIAAKRQAEKFNEVLSSALNIGYVYFDKARGFFMVKEDSNYAIMPQFKKLSQSGKLYQAWDAAIAQRFVDAENSGVDAKDTLGGNFTLKQAQDTVNAYKGDADIQEFLKVYRNFNNSLIELNRYVGNFDVATEARLKAWYYSSYYRVPVDENGQLEAPSKSRGLKAISGRDLQINDMIENFITNAQYMVGYAMKNEADRRSIRDSVDNKLANRLEGPDEKGNIVSSPKFATNKKMVVRVNENGKKAYYEILDPILYKSLSDTRVRLASLAVLGKGFSNFLRTGVTSAPSFMFNNMFLDAFRLWGLGIYEDNVLKSVFGNIYDGFKSVSSEDDTYKTLMKAGLIGSMKLSRDSVQAATDIRRELAIAQGNAFVNLLRTMKNSTLGTLENISAKSEAVNRVQVYKNVNKNMLKKGLSVEAAESAALYAAMNYPVNFDVRGAGEVAQYAAALLPFVNASAQGTDVFYQSLRSMAQTRGVMLKGQKQRVPVNQLQASALAASKSALYNSIIAGTLYTFALAALAPDEWKKATPEERNRNLFIPIGSTAIKIPIPPELGLIALSIPNAFAEAIIGQDNGPQIMKSLASYFINLFTFSPVPQIVRPAAEVAVNKNFFTWRPIENMTEERILPEYRYDENTTLIGRGLGSAAAKLKMPISPMQFDHLIRGYLGTTGMFASDLISQVFGAAIGKNDPDRFRPISDPYLLPVVGKLFTAPNDRKAIQDYYEIRNHATRAANTLKSIDLAKEYKDNPEKLRAMAYWSQINTALEAGPDQHMQELRKLKAKVQVATVDVLTPSQKTDMIKQINMKMSEVARGVQQLKRELPFTWF